jgi:hypothetical protein
VPTGAFVVDGARAGLREPAPAVGLDPAVWRTSGPTSAAPEEPAARRPLDDLRILDLGVIVAGGELGRLFADMGADVVKVERPHIPTGSGRRRPASR